MKTTDLFSKNWIKEILFQALLFGLVFVLYSTERQDEHIHTRFNNYEFVFFVNYAFASYFITYFLLPKYLYRKKYLHTGIYTALVLGAVIFVEEFILEPIFFPGKRAANFPGIFFNLAEMLPIIMILVGFKFAWDAILKQRQVESLEMAVQESELQFLKSQINPHFLFNNLNNLYSYALEASPKTPELILELSAVLRYMLYECQEKYVPLDKEIEHLEKFIGLSELQFEGRGEIKFQSSDMKYGLFIAPLILPVFVENAIKHSSSSQTEDIYIKIDVQLLEDDILQFNCVNRFSDHSNTESISGGIGLQNVKKRLDLIYPNAHKLDIHTEDGMYNVSLSINLKRE